MLGPPFNGGFFAPGTAVQPVVRSPLALLLMAKRCSISKIMAYLCGGRPAARCSASVLRTRVTSTFQVFDVSETSALSQLSSDVLSGRFDHPCTVPPADSPAPPLQPCPPEAVVCVQRLHEEPKSHTVSCPTIRSPHVTG